MFVKIDKSNTTNEASVQVFEAFASFMIGVIITCVVMFLHNDSIICTDTYCYAHRHSWVCYVLWSLVNGSTVMCIWMTLMIFTTFPLLYNIYVFIHNWRIRRPKQTKPISAKEKSVKEVLWSFNNYLGKK